MRPKQKEIVAKELRRESLTTMHREKMNDV